MTEHYHEMKQYLSQKLDDRLTKLEARIRKKSREAWEFHKTPEAQGLSIEQLSDWLEAFPCITFLQSMEDGKIVGADDEEMDRLDSLTRIAVNTFLNFVLKYQHLAPQMNPENFVTEFLEIATVKLSDINPFTPCLRMDLEIIQSTLKVEL